jgi:hypothetical protein
MDISLQNTVIIRHLTSNPHHIYPLSHLILITFIPTNSTTNCPQGLTVTVSTGSGAPGVPSYTVSRDIAGSPCLRVHEYGDLVCQVGCWARGWQTFPVKHHMSRNQNRRKPRRMLGCGDVEQEVALVTGTIWLLLLYLSILCIAFCDISIVLQGATITHEWIRIISVCSLITFEVFAVQVGINTKCRFLYA